MGTFRAISRERLGDTRPGGSGALGVGVSPITGLNASDVQHALALLQQAVTLGVGEPATTTRLGASMLTAPATDLAFPRVVGENDTKARNLAVANFEAVSGADQTINAGTTSVTPLNLAGESYDDGANFASSTFTAPRAGQYWLGGLCFGTGAEDAANLLLYVLLNGATGTGDLGSRVIAGAQAGSVRALVATGGRPFKLAEGATARLGAVYSAPASTDTLVAGTGGTRFYGHYMGV